MFKSGDKVLYIGNSTSTIAEEGQVYTLKDRVDNGFDKTTNKKIDGKKKLWSTEELGVWCVNEKDIQLIT